MQFLYDQRAPQERLCIQNEAFLHLKARRTKVGERIEVRNLKDGKKYLYEVINLDRKCADLELVFTSKSDNFKYDFQIAWAVVDPKTIEKTLPFLNELGVGKIIFVYTEYSQANFKLHIDKFEKICALSCEQCGRDSMMEFEIYKNLDDFLSVYENVALINFGGKSLNEYNNELLFIGSEGGFSKAETQKIQNSFKLENNHVLKSQTAITAIASKFLT